MPDYPREACKSAFVSWRPVAIWLIGIIAGVAVASGAGAVYYTNMRRDICEIQNEQRKILDLWANADTIKADVREIKRALERP